MTYFSEHFWHHFPNTQGLKITQNVWFSNTVSIFTYLASIGLWCSFCSLIEKCLPKSQLPKVLKNVHDSFWASEGLEFSSEATLDLPPSCPFLWCNSSWCWTFASTAFNCLGLNSKVSRAWYRIWPSASSCPMRLATRSFRQGLTKRLNLLEEPSVEDQNSKKNRSKHFIMFLLG